MKRASLFTAALIGAMSLIPNRVFAGPYDALSEIEISEMLTGGETPEYTNATPEPESVSRTSEEDDEVDSELGQNGVMDALHESSRADVRAGSFDSPTPVPAAKPESWMKGASHSQKKIKKVAKALHKAKKVKKVSKKIRRKKGKHIASAKAKKKYMINKKRFARR